MTILSYIICRCEQHDHFYFNIKHMRVCFYHKKLNAFCIAYVTIGKEIWTKVSTESNIIGAYVSGKYHIYFFAFLYIYLACPLIFAFIGFSRFPNVSWKIRSIIYFCHIVLQIWICQLYLHYTKWQTRDEGGPVHWYDIF